MNRHMLWIGLAMLGGVAGNSPANACVSPCVPYAPAYGRMMVYQPYEMPQIYVVDRGPVYSGPGIYTEPTIVRPHRLPAYPYVRYDYPPYHGPYYSPALRARAQAR